MYELDMDDGKNFSNSPPQQSKMASPHADKPMNPSSSSEKSIEIFSPEPSNPEKRDINSQNAPPSEPPTELTSKGEDGKNPAIQQEDFSIFTSGQKKVMVMVASLASLFSPMATAIYCWFPSTSSPIPTHITMNINLRNSDPSLDTISTDLGVSNSKINITVTIFLVRSLHFRIWDSEH